jgi:hypothetical protein
MGVGRRIPATAAWAERPFEATVRLLERRIAATVALLCLTVGGCSLQEITIVDVEDVVVAEVYVQIGEGFLGGDRVTAFLHRTVGGLGGGFHPVPGAKIVISQDRGPSVELAETAIERCVSVTPEGGTGSCYWMAPAASVGFRPGDHLRLRIDLASGGVLTSSTIVPGDFAVLGITEGAQCLLAPSTPFTVRWTGSEGTWAYVNETLILGMKNAFLPLGIEVESDTLELLGLSISASDTTIVFPGEFGIFTRFELDQDLATSLQAGLPPGTRAPVTISATDRNYVNWARGGTFNPSGQVRVPSVRGDGTGVFASTVTRTFEVVVNPAPLGGSVSAPACPAS